MNYPFKLHNNNRRFSNMG